MKMKETRKKREKEGERGRRRENGSSINAAMTSPDWLFEFNMAPTWRINQGRASLAYHRAPRHFPLPPSPPPPPPPHPPASTPFLNHHHRINAKGWRWGEGGTCNHLSMAHRVDNDLAVDLAVDFEATSGRHGVNINTPS